MRVIAVFVSLAVVLSAPGVLADEGDEPVELNESAFRKVDLIADFAVGDGDEAAIEAAAAEVTDLRTAGVGWGAMLKIYKLAAAMGVPASELLAEIGADGEFSFGEMKKLLTEEQRQAFDEMPKNFGTLVAAEKKAEAEAKKADKRAEREARKQQKKAERDERKGARGSSDQDGTDE